MNYFKSKIFKVKYIRSWVIILHGVKNLLSPMLITQSLGVVSSNVDELIMEVSKLLLKWITPLPIILDVKKTIYKNWGFKIKAKCS